MSQMKLKPANATHELDEACESERRGCSYRSLSRYRMPNLRGCCDCIEKALT